MNHQRAPRTFAFDTLPHILVVQSCFYGEVAEMLLHGATGALEQAQASWDVCTVPGALEIPAAIMYAIKALNYDALRRRYDGYIALGTVIKGGTMHDEIVGMTSAQGLQNLALQHALAIGNGILTCNTMEQAVERAHPERMNRGAEAAEACLAMVELKQQMRLTPRRRWVGSRT